MTARKMPPCPVEGCRETRHHWHDLDREGQPGRSLSCFTPWICEAGSPCGTRCYGAARQAEVWRGMASGLWWAELRTARGGELILARTHADALAWALREVGL